MGPMTPAEAKVFATARTNVRRVGDQVREMRTWASGYARRVGARSDGETSGAPSRIAEQIARYLRKRGARETTRNQVPV